MTNFDHLSADPTEDAFFSHVLSRAITASGLSLQEISDALAHRGSSLSPTMLSFWRTGRSLPTHRRSLRALWQLDEILGLPPGTLATSLGDDDDAWLPHSVLPAGQELQSALRELGHDLTRSVSLLLVHESSLVHADVIERTSRRIVRVDREGLSAMLMLLDLWPGAQVSSMRSKLGRVDWRLVAGGSERPVVLAAAPLPRGTQTGDLVTLELQFEAMTRGNAAISQGLPGLASHLVIDATFDAPVGEAWYHCRPSQPGQAMTREPLPAGRHCQLAVGRARPGVHTLRWSW